MRLQKYMSQCGIASRRKSEELIVGGQVKVNGITVTELGTKIDMSKDSVMVQGKIIKPKELAYIILYKPRNYISSCSDPRGRKTVLDLLPKSYQNLYPVGRLDWDSEGLVFLTNDGELAYRVSHPSYGVEKSYLVTTSNLITEEDLTALREGVLLDDGLTAPAKVHLIKKNNKEAILEIIIREGRNRQIRRMLDVRRLETFNLKRTRIGPLSLSGLKLGEFRLLKDYELKALKEI